MERIAHVKFRWFFIPLLALVIFISCVSPYYTANEAYKSFRVKKVEELSAANDNTSLTIDSNAANFYSSEGLIPQAAFDDIILLLLNNKIITIYILSLLLALFQLHRYIRGRNILVSQTKNKLIMVHCLQRKDGKKGTPSFCCS
jgi:hypothetical protein